jgi:peptide/nickel transport system permease protein
MEMIRREYGLDQPLHIQLVLYVKQILMGNLGYSYYSREPVAQLIFERVGNTLLLMLPAITFAALIGVVLGVISSTDPHSAKDRIIAFFCSIGCSIPAFWLSQMLILLFALYLGWFPVVGMSSLGTNVNVLDAFIDLLRHLFLPVLALSTFYITLITRITRASMLEEFQKDYIMTARSKGISEGTVVYRHALRNALIPVVTIGGVFIGYMLSGAVLVETVFSWPGLGRLMFDSLLRRDYPLLVGMLIFTGIAMVIAQLIVDVVYTLLDPRIRYK